MTTLVLTPGNSCVTIAAGQVPVTNYLVTCPTAPNEAEREEIVSAPFNISIALTPGDHNITVTGLSASGTPIPGEAVTHKVTIAS